LLPSPLVAVSPSTAADTTPPTYYHVVPYGTAATFTVSGTQNSTPESTAEAKPGNKEWHCVGTVSLTDANNNTLIADMQPWGTDAANDWNSNSSRSVSMSGEWGAGTYSLSFTMSVRFQKLRKQDDSVIYKTGANGNPLTDSSGNPIPDYFDGGSATYSLILYVVEVKSIKVGSQDFTNDIITVLKGSQTTLTAIPNPNIWPENNPVWSCPTLTITPPNGSNFTFNAYNTGSYALTVTCGTSNKTVTVKVVEPVLESINFEGGDIQTIADVGTTPEWQRNPSRNEPFSSIKGSSDNAVVKLSIPYELTISTPITIYANTATRTTSFQGLNATATFIIDVSASVGKFTINTAWKYSVSPNAMNQTLANITHTYYCTWGTMLCEPSDFTKAHLAYACEKAQGATTLVAIGDKIGPDATAVARFGVNYEPQGTDICTHDLSLVWRLIDENKKGDCATLCTLMKAAILLLGDNSASIKFVFARHASWSGLDKDSGARTNNETRAGVGTELGFIRNINYNYFEGCCLFQNKWWMGGLGTSKTSAYNVLMDVSSPNNSSTNRRQVWFDLQSTPVSYPSGTP
jgi:hypothetical protein